MISDTEYTEYAQPDTQHRRATAVHEVQPAPWRGARHVFEGTTYSLAVVNEKMAHRQGSGGGYEGRYTRRSESPKNAGGATSVSAVTLPEPLPQPRSRRAT